MQLGNKSLKQDVATHQTIFYKETNIFYQQTSVDIDTTVTLSGEPTEQRERLRPKEVFDNGTKISSLKSQVVTEECIKHDLSTGPEKQKADVDQSSLGASVSTV